MNNPNVTEKLKALTATTPASGSVDAIEKLKEQIIATLPKNNLACPFCGSVPRIKIMFIPRSAQPRYKVECSDWEKCQMQCGTMFEDDYETVQRNWNRRTPLNADISDRR